MPIVFSFGVLGPSVLVLCAVKERGRCLNPLKLSSINKEALYEFS